MPTDVSMYGNLAAPYDPMAVQAKYAIARNAALETNVRQQQLEQGNLKLQEQQRATQSQEIIRQAWMQHAGDLDKTVETAIAGGAGPVEVQALQKHAAELAEKKSKIKVEELPVLKYQNEQTLGAFESLTQLAKTDPEGYARQWPANHAALIRINPDLAKHVDAAQPMSVDDLQTGILGAQTNAWAMTKADEARKVAAEQRAAAGETRTADTYVSEAPVRAAKAAQAVAETAARANPNDPALQTAALTAQQRTEAAQKVADAKQLETHQKEQDRIARGRLAVDQGDLSRKVANDKRTAGGALESLTPQQKSIAQKLASGDMNPTLLMRFPDKEALIAGAIALNPSWSNQTYATKASFTDPQKNGAKNLMTIGRIVGHIERFEGNSRKLGFAPAYAAGMNLTGDQNKANNDAHAIAAELEKLLSGGVGTLAQMKGWTAALKSPDADARQQSIDEISQLIGSQYDAMNQGYKAGTGEDLPLEKHVTPAGRAWMQKKGINVGGAAPAAAAAGGVAVVNTKAEYDKLPAGATYTDAADGKQYKKK